MAAQEQAGTAWLDATPFGHSAHFVGCALRSAGRFTSLTGASRLVTYGAKPRPQQKSGYVHALLTTCLGIRFTPAQIGWTPPDFYWGLGSPSLTRGLRPQAITTPWAVLIQLGLYLITRLPQELNHERLGRSMTQLKSKSA